MKAKILSIVSLMIVFALSVQFVYTHLPVNVEWSRLGPPSVGVDWKNAFRPAAREVLHLRSPYNEPSFLYPPWVTIPLLPVALFSPALGAAVLYVLNLFCYLFAGAKFKFNPLAFAIFFLFSGILANSTNGNVEGLLALGFILTPQIGLFFVLAKPQFGLAVAVFWLIEACREGGIRQAIKTFMPVSIAFALSFILFGFGPARTPDLTGAWWNASIFPYGVPIGLLLLGFAIWRREIRFAITASPFFAPYLTGHTWSVVWFGLLALIPQWFPLRSFALKDKRGILR